jgi:EAL domain-containing protein (putative c-di-GMP-specific phosphodiesterase class I)
MAGSVAPRVRDRQYVGPRTFRSYLAIPPLLVGSLVVVALLVAWGTTYLAGGSRTVFPHLFYVPVMMAAVRFGLPGAVATAVAAGVLAGPLVPADVATGTAQDTSAWVTRLLIFVSVGLLLAWITSHTRPGLLSSGHDARVSMQLRRALRRGDLEVHYQPQVDLESHRVVGVEALVRWAHPTEGLVAPVEFIPAAESTGTIDAVDRYVLHEATAQLAAWSRAGHEDLTMSVNLSAHRFQDPGLVDDIAAALRTTGIEPSRLHLEVTETAIIADVAQAARQIAALRALGVKIAIDDFGAGQSSLSYLHRFVVDVMKIDRGFTANVVEDPRVGRLVAGMVRLFESVGVTVVGEGIANAEQFVHMTSLRCQIGQGFYIARPAPADEITAWLDRSRARTGRLPGPGDAG